MDLRERRIIRITSTAARNGRDGARYRRDCIGNMTFQETADLAGGLRPGLVIPGHWDMFADNPGNPQAFADYPDAKDSGTITRRIPALMEDMALYYKTAKRDRR